LPIGKTATSPHNYRYIGSLYMKKDPDQKIRLIAIGLSFGIGLVLMSLKFYIFHLTQSSAVLSDALESIINVVTSAFAAVSIWIAAKPPDAKHPYGHGKIEFFSAGFEGALIIIAAVGIFKTGIDHIFNPFKLPHLESGLALLATIGLINLFLGFFLLRIGHRTASFTLIADGKHILTDVYTSFGVILGLGLVYLTGWTWMDGLIACIVGINILATGGKLVFHAFAGLMDSSDPELLDEISALLNAHRKNHWINVHQLRAWSSGNHVHMDFHLVLPRNFSLVETHHEIKEIERLMSDQFDGRASVLVHTDPCKDPHCVVCQHYNCRIRTEQPQKTSTWSSKQIVQKN
jgi:cation diffusion facilitator family transporter